MERRAPKQLSLFLLFISHYGIKRNRKAESEFPGDRVLTTDFKGLIIFIFDTRYLSTTYSLMNQTPLNWPGVRQTHDGKFSFSINVGNRTYIEGEYFDAESAARALDETKFTFVQSGHLQRANFYHFPAEVSKWQSGEGFSPQPTSALLAFMTINPPKYPPLAQRQAEEAQRLVVKAKKVLTAGLPSPPKLFAAHQVMRKLLAVTPSCLTAEEKAAAEFITPKLLLLAQDA